MRTDVQNWFEKNICQIFKIPAESFLVIFFSFSDLSVWDIWAWSVSGASSKEGNWKRTRNCGPYYKITIALLPSVARLPSRNYKRECNKKLRQYYKTIRYSTTFKPFVTLVLMVFAEYSEHYENTPWVLFYDFIQLIFYRSNFVFV